MSTLTETAPARSRRSTGGEAPSVWQLARFEGRRLVLHPILWGGVAIGSVAFVLATRRWAPVLHRDDILTGAALLPVAAATLLVANLAALRSDRQGTEELLGTTPTTRGMRTLAHLVSVGWAVAVALALVVAGMAYLVGLGAVGSPSAFELLTGPAVVAVMGVLGVVLARLVRSPLAASLALIALAAWQLVTTSAPGDGTRPGLQARWLAPWVEISTADGNPAREMVVRPAGWHLVYLAGAAVAIGTLAVLLCGFRRRRLGTLIGAVALTMVAAAFQLPPPSDGQIASLVALMDHPERFHVCETEHGVRYCAYPAYAPWIERWQRAVSPVVLRVPERARPTDLQVLQTFVQDANSSDVPDPALERLRDPSTSRPVIGAAGPAILTGARWPRGQPDLTDPYRDLGESDLELALALAAAAWAVGMPGPNEPIRLTAEDVEAQLRLYPPDEREGAKAFIYEGAPAYSCDPAGQARSVVSLWLAGQATTETRSALQAQVATWFPELQTTAEGGEQFSPYLGVWGLSADAVQWPAADGASAMQLLGRPDDEVTAVLGEHWERLTDPATTDDDLMDMFGLEAPAPLEDRLVELGLDPEVATMYSTEVMGGVVPCR